MSEHNATHILAGKLSILTGFSALAMDNLNINLRVCPSCDIAQHDRPQALCSLHRPVLHLLSGISARLCGIPFRCSCAHNGRSDARCFQLIKARVHLLIHSPMVVHTNWTTSTPSHLASATAIRKSVSVLITLIVVVAVVHIHRGEHFHQLDTFSVVFAWWGRQCFTPCGQYWNRAQLAVHSLWPFSSRVDLWHPHWSAVLVVLHFMCDCRDSRRLGTHTLG